MVSRSLVQELALKYGIDTSVISLGTLKRAIDTELEHRNIIGPSPENALIIALAHLEESPRYYAMLARMVRHQRCRGPMAPLAGNRNFGQRIPSQVSIAKYNSMPHHFGIRKRRELTGGRISNLPKLAEQFQNMQVGASKMPGAYGPSRHSQAPHSVLSPAAIKKKFSI